MRMLQNKANTFLFRIFIKFSKTEPYDFHLFKKHTKLAVGHALDCILLPHSRNYPVHVLRTDTKIKIHNVHNKSAHFICLDPLMFELRFYIPLFLHVIEILKGALFTVYSTSCI